MINESAYMDVVYKWSLVDVLIDYDVPIVF